MRIWLASLSAALALSGAKAQLLSPESVQGTLLGTFIGGATGGDHHGWSGKGAAIGAGVGFVLGTIAGESNRQRYYNAPYAYPPPTYGYDYGYFHPPADTYAQARLNYAVSGTLLGAASGALIGEGASGKPGKGAAIGAAAGLVLGSLAEQDARRREATVAYASRIQPIPTAGPPASIWQPESTTPRLQIPDAPRVPDAPTF